MVLLSHTLIYPAVITILCAVGASEMLRCIGVWKKLQISIPSMIYATICPVLALNFRYGVFLAVTMGYLFLLLMMLVFANEKVTTGEICTAVTMIIYITICFSSLVKLRYVTTGTGADSGMMIGQYVYLLVFVAAWITDTFAYFTGVFFGKHKLCPKISPKKTIEGSIGGIFFCIIAFVVYGIILFAVNDGKIIPNYIGLAVVGLVMSVLSQTGDLLASVIKRTYGVKDYGKLFPGHGGVLDRFDSVLFLTPFLLVLVEDAQFLQLLFTI